MFYHSAVASVIFSAAVCWGGVIWSVGAIKLDKLVRKAKCVVEVKQDSVEAKTGKRMRRKLQAIMETLLSYLCRAEVTREHVQPQTHPTMCLEALVGLSHTIPSAIRQPNITTTACNTSFHHWLRTQSYISLSHKDWLFFLPLLLFFLLLLFIISGTLHIAQAHLLYLLYFAQVMYIQGQLLLLFLLYF